MKEKIKLFNLLLWYKSLQEEKVKLSLYHATLNLKKIFEEKKMLEDELTDCINYLEEESRFTGEEIRSWMNYLNTLIEFREITDKKVNTQEKILEELKEELKRRNQEKHLMEKLSHKALLNYRLGLTKREEKELDEIALLRKGRGIDQVF